MSSILLYHHLGLGDHFMCHGIVREHCKKYQKVGLFCLPQYAPSISFMYRDIKNLIIINANDSEALEFIKKNDTLSEIEKYDEVKIIGFQFLNKNSNIPLEMQFYQLAGIPFNKKWESFFIERDKERENALIKKMGIQSDYAFVHEDVSRNFVINKDLIDKNCTLITANKSLTDNTIDYCTLIENAKEIHVIDSSFMFLVEFLQYDNPNQKIFIHRYARENHEWLLPILKKDWRIIIDRHDKKNPAKEALRILLGRHNTILRKIVRRIFKRFQWDMVRPSHANLVALIKRYVFEKSFLIISSTAIENTYALTAKNAGAITTEIATLGEAKPADTVLYSGEFSKNKDSSILLKTLHAITKGYMIFHTKNCDLKYLESSLAIAGFEIREKHLFPFESCFVCKSISKN
jgi:hypothetical protein